MVTEGAPFASRSTSNSQFQDQQNTDTDILPGYMHHWKNVLTSNTGQHFGSA